MLLDKQYYVYIMTNYKNTTLYTGMTDDLVRRVNEHLNHSGSYFTGKYNLIKLVYFEIGNDVNEVIKREKQIKAGSRKKKIQLIENTNSEWKDLYPQIISNK